MRWCVAAFLPLLVGAINHYEIEGVFSEIKPEDVRHSLNHRAGFLPSEQKIRRALESLSSSFVTDFFIDFFEIHGEAHGHSTTIFHGFLSTELTRIDIEKLIKDHENLHIFLLLAKDKVPPAPSLVAAPNNFDLSCSNGGVLLPNSTCACRPFYAGPSCEEVQCLHNGIQTGGRCSCPPGVSTLHCEPRSCIPGLVDDFNRDKSTFVLVVNQDISVAKLLNQLFGQLNNLNYDSYSTFLVVNYLLSSKGFYMQYKQFTYWTDMLDYLNGIVSIASGSPIQPTNAAVALAQSFSPDMLPFSRILVVTSSVDQEDQPISNDISADLLSNTVFLRALAWRNRIVYLIPDADPTRATLYSVFDQISQATLGYRVFFDGSSGDPSVLSSILNDLNQVEPIVFVNGVGDMEVDVTSNENITVLITTKPGSKNLPTVATDDNDITFLGEGTFIQILSIPPVSTIKLSFGDTWTLMAFNQGTKTAIVSYSDDQAIDVGTAYASIGGSQVGSGAIIGSPENVTLEWINPSSGSTLFEGVEGVERDDQCSFPLSFGSFDQLTTPGIYYQRVTFGDSGDVRLIPGFVGNLVPQHAPSRTCFNGGTKKMDGSCDCVSGFFGRDCTIVECMNFGTPNQFPGGNLDLCLCPPGFHGDHCEKKQCYSNGNDFFNQPNKSLVLVVQSSMSQAIVNGYLASGLSDLLINDRKQFDEFVITTFNNVAKGGQNITKINTNTYTTYGDFLTALTNISYLASYTPVQDSTNALKAAIETLTFYNSPIYLMVDSPATTTNNDNEVVKAALDKLASVNVIQTSPFNSQNSASCLSSDSSLFYQNLAINTGGVYLNLCGNVGQISKYFHNYGPYFYGMQLVSEERPAKCAVGFNFELNVQEAEQSVFVLNGASSSNFEVSLIADGDKDSAQKLNPASNGIPALGIYSIPLGYIDNKNKYTISVVSKDGGATDLCSARVLTKSNFAAFFGLNSLDSTNATSSLNYGNPFQITFFSNTNLDGQSGSINVLFPTKATADNEFAPQECKNQILFPNNFACDGANDHIIIKGQVQLEQNSFITRSQRTICYQTRNTCLNGGTWENNKCKCTDLYNGTYCEIPLCLNGFSGTSERTCQCYHSSAPAQYSGTHCEQEVCPSMNYMEAADSREFDFRQIIFVVNTNVDMLLVDVYLKSMMEQFSNEVQDPVNPKQFTLVTFDESNVVPVISTSNVAKFVSAFNTALSGFSKISGQNTRSLDALHEALRLVVEPTATIFLITGTSSTDPVLTGGILPSQRIGTQINLIYTPQGAIAPALPLDERLTMAARTSGGRILPLTQNSLPQFYNFAKESIKENALIWDGGVADCKIVNHYAFWVDNKVTRLIFDITGFQVDSFIEVDDQKGQKVNLTRKFVDNGAVIAELVETSPGSLAGQWSFGVSSNTGSCYMQIRAESSMRVIPGFTKDLFDDFPTAEPFAQRGNPSTSTRVVARLTGAQGAFIKGVEIDGIDPVHPWNSTQIQYADADQRDPSKCAFQYASQAFDMDTAYRYQRFRFTGQDSDGNYIRRLFFYDMANPESTCVNGAVDATGLCACDANHFGDDCAERRCVNGGTSSFGICACPTNYYGLYCENYFPASETTEAPLPTTTTRVTTAPQFTTEALPSTNQGQSTATSISQESTTVFTTGASSNGAISTAATGTTLLSGVTSETSVVPSEAAGTSTVAYEPTSGVTIGSSSIAPASTAGLTTPESGTTLGATAPVSTVGVVTPEATSAGSITAASQVSTQGYSEGASSTSGGSSSSATISGESTATTPEGVTDTGTYSTLRTSFPASGSTEAVTAGSTTSASQGSTQANSEASSFPTTEGTVASVGTDAPQTTASENGVSSTAASTSEGTAPTSGSGTTLQATSSQPATESTTVILPASSLIPDVTTSAAPGSSTASSTNVAATVGPTGAPVTENDPTGATNSQHTSVADQTTTISSATTNSAEGQSTATVQVTTSTEGSALTGTTAAPATEGGSTVGSQTPVILQSTVQVSTQTEVTNPSQTTLGAIGTTEGLQSTANIETTTEVVTTETTTMATTTTPGPCDPVTTTYFYSFFIDSADFFPPSNTYNQEHIIVSAVASNVSLGSGHSNTRFAISGVMSTFYPGGIANNTDDIDGFFQGGSLYGFFDNALNFTAAVDGYLDSGYSDILPEEVPGIAVLFAHLQPEGTVDEFADAVSKLKQANYKVIGIDMNSGLLGGPSDYLSAVLGPNNVFGVTTEPKEAVDFITSKGCQFKPL